MGDELTTPPAGARRSRAALLSAVAAVAVVAAGLGAYMGIRAASGGAAGPGGAAPSPRESAAMGFDAARGQVVLFGGLGRRPGDAGSYPQQPLGDTWTWDGSAWTQRHPAVSPPPGGGDLMAYDPVSRDVLLVTTEGPTAAPALSSGGPIPAPAPPATWMWDGSSWHRSAAAITPTLVMARMATDSSAGRVVMVTSSVTPGPPQVYPCPLRTPEAAGPLPFCGPPAPVALRTWTWTGSSWRDTHAGSPVGADGFQQAGSGFLVDDPRAGHLDYFSVADGIVPACAAPAQSRRSGGAPAVPPSDVTVCPSVAPGTVVQPAFSPGTTVSHWNGAAWSAPRALTLRQNLLGGGVMLGDAATRSVLCLPAGPGTAVLAYTGTWQRAPGSMPAASGFAAAYDSATGQVVRFGGLVSVAGQPGTPALSSQTWTYDGSRWTQHGGTAVRLPTPVAVGVPGSSAAPAPSSGRATPGPPLDTAGPASPA